MCACVRKREATSYVGKTFAVRTSSMHQRFHWTSAFNGPTLVCSRSALAHPEARERVAGTPAGSGVVRVDPSVPKLVVPTALIPIAQHLVRLDIDHGMGTLQMALGKVGGGGVEIGHGMRSRVKRDACAPKSESVYTG